MIRPSPSFLPPSSFLALLAAALLAACAGPFGTGGGRRYDYSMKPKPNDFDRTGFGTSPLPIWMGLTAPEQRALANRGKAAAGDPAALLDLAIFASGSPRGAAGYDSIHRRVEAFVAGVRDEVDGEKTAYKKGFKLFKAMHAEFFPAPSRAAAAGVGAEEADPGMAGYEFDQSALAPIFTQRKFNCISSAMLYAVLARHFGLEAKGVVLASHAFVQLETPEGKVIEVETTTPTGYDWVHDEAFYRKRAGAWFSARGLPASTFKDYQKREIISPLALIAYNMNNQHTAPSRMEQVDRCRIAEAMAFLLPKDREAQVNRLDLYNTEYLWLKQRKDFAVAEAMFAKVKPVLSEARADFPKDAEISNRIGWAWLEYAASLHELGRDLDGIAYVDSSLACLRLDEKQGPQLRANNLAMIQMVVGDLGGKKRFAEAEALLARYPGFAKEDASFRKTQAWLHNQWAVELWNAENWEGAIAQFEKQKAAGTLADRKPAMENMTNAYLNWAAGHQNEGDWPKTRDVLSRCVEKTQARKCRTLLEQIVAQHRME